MPDHTQIICSRLTSSPFYFEWIWHITHMLLYFLEIYKHVLWKYELHVWQCAVKVLFDCYVKQIKQHLLELIDFVSYCCPIDTMLSLANNFESIARYISSLKYIWSFNSSIIVLSTTCPNTNIKCLHILWLDLNLMQLHCNFLLIVEQ